MPAAVTRLRVRYSETDRMGVVYYANYFVWFEVARGGTAAHARLDYREMEATGVFLPVIEAHCEYRRPARYDDEIEVHAEGRVCSFVRMEFDYGVVITGQTGHRGHGRTLHAAVGGDGRPCRLPARIREAFE